MHPQFHKKSNHSVDGNRKNPQKIHRILNLNPCHWELWAGGLWPPGGPLASDAWGALCQ